MVQLSSSLEKKYGVGSSSLIPESHSTPRRKTEVTRSNYQHVSKFQHPPPPPFRLTSRLRPSLFQYSIPVTIWNSNYKEDNDCYGDDDGQEEDPDRCCCEDNEGDYNTTGIGKDDYDDSWDGDSPEEDPNVCCCEDMDGDYYPTDIDKDDDDDNLEVDPGYRCVENTTDVENNAEVEQPSCSEVSSTTGCRTGPKLVDTDTEEDTDFGEVVNSDNTDYIEEYDFYSNQESQELSYSQDQDDLSSFSEDNTEVNGLSGKDEESQDLMSAGADPNMKPNLRMKKKKESNLKMKKKMPFKIFIT